MKTILSLLLVSSLLMGAQAQPTNVLLVLEKTILLPGVDGRIDHLAVDVGGQRLFLAALGNGTVEVIDLKNGKPLQSLPHFGEPQGVVYVPELDRLFVATAKDGSCHMLDGHSFKPIHSVELGDDADNIRYDGSAKSIYVGYGNGALGVVDAKTGRQTSDITLTKHPESFQLETGGQRIFVNVPGAKHIAVIDREKGSVVATWPLTEARSNFPMILDEANHRLFIGCRWPARLLVLDTTNGKTISQVGISGDTDDVFYDAKRQRLYVSCGEGFLDVIQRIHDGQYQRIAHEPTRSGARTSFFSPETDRLYLAVPKSWGRAAELRIYQLQ